MSDVEMHIEALDGETIREAKRLRVVIEGAADSVQRMVEGAMLFSQSEIVEARDGTTGEILPLS